MQTKEEILGKHCYYYEHNVDSSKDSVLDAMDEWGQQCFEVARYHHEVSSIEEYPNYDYGDYEEYCNYLKNFKE